jgi:hypothetical protein
MGTVTGKDAKVALMKEGGSWKDHSVWAFSDFSLTFDRGTVEQELVGQPGNWFSQGALSIDGSFTNCRFAASGNADSLESIIESSYIKVSGSTGSDLSWYFNSAQVTGYDISIGDADTISEASIDFTILNPYQVNIDTSTGHIEDTG